MSFSEMFYANVLPIMTLAAFLYIIYLLFFREAHFDKIEEKFERAIRKNMEFSENIINKHFETSQHRMMDTLEEFDRESKKEISATLNKLKDISTTQKEIDKEIKEQLRLYNELLVYFNDLVKKNEEQVRAIEQRDATIARKSIQIKRLMNAK